MSMPSLEPEETPLAPAELESPAPSAEPAPFRRGTGSHVATLAADGDRGPADRRRAGRRRLGADRPGPVRRTGAARRR